LGGASHPHVARTPIDHRAAVGLPFPGLPVVVPSVVRTAAPVMAVVPAVHIAVVIVVAGSPLPVRTPPRVPPLTRAPVVRREWRGLSLCRGRGPQSA
jgi:hypothetical protein